MRQKDKAHGNQSSHMKIQKTETNISTCLGLSMITRIRDVDKTYKRRKTMQKKMQMIGTRNAGEPIRRKY